MPVGNYNKMDIRFVDPEEVPQSPEDVRIREIRPEVYNDGRRVRVWIELTPFQVPPNLEVEVYDSDGLIVTSASVIEPVDHRMSMTLHLRGEDVHGEYLLRVSVGYPDENPVDRQEVHFRNLAE
ncbi:MAG: hypothetical protein GTO18_19770 [Anaerolineales bacterium]|nr:hypothetical protein [Anaerolineales bacterium]